VLAPWIKSPLEENSLHFETLSWFWTYQSLFLFINYACLAEKQQMPIVQSFVWPEPEHTIYCTQDEHDKHYTADAVLIQ
jgi:hypothetical protein